MKLCLLQKIVRQSNASELNWKCSRIRFKMRSRRRREITDEDITRKIDTREAEIRAREGRIS